ncbi:MAG: HlyD family type I secretion periplasmic adaptor subunit [Halothiobacillaceae bacterium]
MSSLPSLPSPPQSSAEPDNNPLKSNPTPVIRLGLLVILIGFVGFLAWAALAPLDAGVTASGTVTVESKRKTIQHLNGGIVQEILVKDGDVVRKDQVLIRLDPTQIEAQRQITRNQLVIAKAIQARLLAERMGEDNPSFDDPIFNPKDEPIVREAITTQMALFRSRRQTLMGQLSILDTSIRGLEQQIEGLQALERGKAEQEKLLRDEAQSLRALLEKGYVPRNRIFELERAIADISSRRSGDLADIGRAQAALNELRLKKLQLQKEYHKEVESQLTDAQRDVASLRERLVALDDELSRVEIRSPADGIVVGLNVHTIGGVIRAGEPILDLVPEGDPLIIEARIKPHLIEKVAVDLSALVRFVALDNLNPVVNGKVIGVSADVLTDKVTGEPYYVARIMVPQEEMLKLKYERINPGMPVDVVIKTGERSLLEYLLRPLLSHLFLALRER